MRYASTRTRMVEYNMNRAIGSSWEEVKQELLTPQEIAESKLRVAILSELIDARRKQGISQKKLEELSGVKQPVIARMEHGSANTRLGTIVKVLASLGKTLAVVPLAEENCHRAAQPK